MVVAWAWAVTVILILCGVGAWWAQSQSAQWTVPDLFVTFWRVAHLMPLQSEAGTISLLPMIGALVVFAVLGRAARWLWRSLRATAPRLATGGIWALGLAYLIVALFVATSPTPRGVSGSGPNTSGLLAVTSLVVVAIGWAWLQISGPTRYPGLTALSRAVRSTLLLLSLGALIVIAVQLWLNWEGFTTATDSLLNSGATPATTVDAVALIALQLAYLPNAIVWTIAYGAGLGFSAGLDTEVSPFTVDLGTLPNLPLLAVLPERGLDWAVIPPLLVAGCAAAGAVLVRRAGYGWRLRSRLVIAIGLSALTGLAMLGLSAAAGGDLGDGRLVGLGPDPITTALAVAVVSGVGYLGWAVFPTLIADLRPYAGSVGRRVRRSPSSGGSGD